MRIGDTLPPIVSDELRARNILVPAVVQKYDYEAVRDSFRLLNGVLYVQLHPIIKRLFLRDLDFFLVLLRQGGVDVGRVV